MEHHVPEKWRTICRKMECRHTVMCSSIVLVLFILHKQEALDLLNELDLLPHLKDIIQSEACWQILLENKKGIRTSVIAFIARSLACPPFCYP